MQAEEVLLEVHVNDDGLIWEDTSDIEGRYANCFKIGFNAFEFVLDFGQTTGGDERVRSTVRVISNPRSAKVLYHTLKQVIKEYEVSFGAIPTERGE